MCGIFGTIFQTGNTGNSDFLKKTINKLFTLSESRGREAAGVALLNENKIFIYKDSITASKMIRTDNYREILSKATQNENDKVNQSLAALGHSRLVTNGMQGIDKNNQPLAQNGIVCVHNGIIVNDTELWQSNPKLQRTTEVDTEVLLALLSLYIKDGHTIPNAIANVFSQIIGETSIGLLFAETNILLLATNTGSIHFSQNTHKDMFVFASENHILKQLLKQKDYQQFDKPRQLPANNMLIVDLKSMNITQSSLAMKKETVLEYKKYKRSILDKWHINETKRQDLKRCSQCILPETMPYIQFNDDGVCNYCDNYEKIQYHGRENLNKILDKYRKNNGEPDCLIAFSGGRDSCYGLHLLKNELGMNPLAYTYDWGMVTDIARRNQSRMCASLGVEHIWVSADIKAKRRNIKCNVEAWLKQPDLGMIPIFMAGDKQFFYYANKIMQQNNLDLVVLCENRLERTDFKTGFCGMPPHFQRKSVYKLTQNQKLNLLKYYATQYLKNPKYINRSILDTLFAYASYYLIKHEHLVLFNYLNWNEKEVNRVLLEQYNWEIATDTASTWRIGDGTAAFYNYLYYTIAGFTEFDTFRSNQIREKTIDREQALAFVKQENQPRFNTIREYLYTIGVDFNQAIRTINSIPKLY